MIIWPLKLLQPAAVWGGAPLDTLSAGLMLQDRSSAPRHLDTGLGLVKTGHVTRILASDWLGAREDGACDHGAVLQPHREALIRARVIYRALSSSEPRKNVANANQLIAVM